MRQHFTNISFNNNFIKKVLHHWATRDAGKFAIKQVDGRFKFHRKKKLERKIFNVSLSPNLSLSFTLLSLPLMKGQRSNPNLNFALLFYGGNLTFAMINWFDKKFCASLSHRHSTSFIFYFFRNRWYER